jgi:protoheme IX farnesyltransferase
MRPSIFRSLALFRPRLSLMNGIAAAGGYLLFPAAASTALLIRVTAGVTLLAAAGSAVNQVMERDLDRLMARTRSRPLPQGHLTPKQALVMAGLCLVLGFFQLSASGVLPVLLGGTTLVCYLGVYTPLKRRTPFALALGGICGALTPVIGWCSAGGRAADYRVMLLAGLLYLWQIPHFWLFQHRHGSDYRRAGLPLVSARTKGAGPAALCRLWIVALLAGALLLPAFGLIGPGLAYWYAGALLCLGLLSLIGSETILFACLNLFPLLVPVVLVIQGYQG